MHLIHEIYVAAFAAISFMTNFYRAGDAMAMAPSPLPDPLLNFMQFSGKFGQIVCWTPWSIGALTSRKSPDLEEILQVKSILSSM